MLLGSFFCFPQIYPPLCSSSQTKMVKAHPKHVPWTEIWFCTLSWVREPPSRMKEARPSPKRQDKTKWFSVWRVHSHYPWVCPQIKSIPRESQLCKRKGNTLFTLNSCPCSTPVQGWRSASMGRRSSQHAEPCLCTNHELSPFTSIYMGFQNPRKISYWECATLASLQC